MEATLHTNLGDIRLELYPEQAPETVSNFVGLATGQKAWTDPRTGAESHAPLYDNVIFHRVIPGFMIQGGGHTADMKEKPTREPIANEAHNGLKNLRGSIAMARTSNPHSATAQFFINLVDNDALNPGGADAYGYAVFGKVVSGMSTVDAIAKVKTGARLPYADVPEKTVTIQTVEILPEPKEEKAK